MNKTLHSFLKQLLDHGRAWIDLHNYDCQDHLRISEFYVFHVRRTVYLVQFSSVAIATQSVGSRELRCPFQPGTIYNCSVWSRRHHWPTATAAAVEGLPVVIVCRSHLDFGWLWREQEVTWYIRTAGWVWSCLLPMPGKREINFQASLPEKVRQMKTTESSDADQLLQRTISVFHSKATIVLLIRHIRLSVIAVYDEHSASRVF